MLKIRNYPYVILFSRVYTRTWYYSVVRYEYIYRSIYTYSQSLYISNTFYYLIWKTHSIRGRGGYFIRLVNVLCYESIIFFCKERVHIYYTRYINILLTRGYVLKIRYYPYNYQVYLKSMYSYLLCKVGSGHIYRSIYTYLYSFVSNTFYQGGGGGGFFQKVN